MTRRRIILISSTLLLTTLSILTFLGTRGGERPNALMPTLGGMQLWTDEILQDGWRVQRHIGTGHCRLLDGIDYRQAWGEAEDCRTALIARRFEAKIASNAKKMTILVHGLGGFGWTFRDMKPALKASGVNAQHWNYASTRGSLAEHVSAFHKMMNNLEEVEEVSFVAHSLGGLLLRKALADVRQPWQARIKVTKLIMIGTPNQGTALADRFKDSSWFQLAFDTAGQDLTSGYAATVPLPKVPYYLIAGKLDGEGNPLIPGPDDGMVSIEEARLQPGDEMLIIAGNHAAITADEKTIQFVLQSLSSLDAK